MDLVFAFMCGGCAILQLQSTSRALLQKRRHRRDERDEREEVARFRRLIPPSLCGRSDSDRRGCGGGKDGNEGGWERCLSAGWERGLRDRDGRRRSWERQGLVRQELL